MSSQDLHTAARSGDAAAVARLLKVVGVDVNFTNPDGQTPLFVAAQSGNLGVVRTLLAAGAGVDIADNDGCTPLHMAALEGHLEVAEALRTPGPDVEQNKPLVPENAMAALSVTPVPQAATPAQPSPGAKDICFSARTCQLPFVRQLVAKLAEQGVSSYFQDHISLVSPQHWQTQWFNAAVTAKVVVCLICKDFLESEPCCEEFGTAKSEGKLVVVRMEPKAVLRSAKGVNSSGPPLMYITQGLQVLEPDVDFIVSQLLKRLQQPCHAG